MRRYSEPTKRVRNGEETRIYWVRVNDSGRRTWKSTGRKTRKLAVEQIKTWELRDAKGERHVEDIGLREAAETWLSAKETDVSPACYRVYKSYVKHWVRFFHSRPLRSIERKHCENYFKRRKKEKASVRTRNNERAGLRSLFTYALDSGWVYRNPLSGIKKSREPKRKIRFLNDAEERRFLEECAKESDQLHGFALTLFRSGLRRGAVASLEWSDIDFSNGEWQIPAAKMKSDEDFVGRPIDPRLLEHLRERAKTSGLVFGQLDSAGFRRAAVAAGISWLRPHDARRTFVTKCSRRGIPMEVCMHLSDHRDLKTVVESYCGIEKESAQAALRKLADDPGSAPRKREA